MFSTDCFCDPWQYRSNGQLALPLRMTKAEAALFEELLRTGTFYLEWGSGGSTLAAVKSDVQQIVSVETDRAWVDRLRQNEEIARAVANERLIPGMSMSGRLVTGVCRPEQKRYATGRDMRSSRLLRDQSDFDVILVDGRFRIQCLLAAANCAPMEQESAPS